MRYALLIYASEQDWANQSEEQAQTQFQEYMAFTKDIVDRGLQKSGEALQPTATATTVRVRDGETVTTDGPFAETTEQLGGFYIIEATDLDEAVEVAARIPDVRNGSI
ncbi:MAG TPA: YciI family protein, partial [Propionibacteriaceae bacterium]|nr:YciI family protein [Propionibacteriaceae bacterium]